MLSLPLDHSAETSPLRNRLLLIAAAVLFSTGGVAVKGVAFTGWQVACFRSGTAAIVLLAVLPGARRGWNWRMVPVAAAYAATLISFVLANRLTTAADAIFLQSTAPFYLLLLGPLLLHEPIRRADLLYLLVVASGMLLFFTGTETPLATAPDPSRGNIVGAASGLTYALTLAGIRWVSRQGRDAGMATVTLGNVFACLAALPLALPVTHADPSSVAVVVYLGVFQIGLAYVCVTRAMRHVKAFEANTLLLLEPALNPVWVWMIQGERPGIRALAGGIIILTATFVNTWRQRRSM
jgi:drug/metabolite transporter (DMT)-like permease